MKTLPAPPIATALGEISATTEVTALADGTLLRVMVALPRASEEPPTVPVAEFCIAAARAGRRSTPAMRIPMIPVAISRAALRDPLTLTPPSFNSPARFFPRPAPLTSQFTRPRRSPAVRDRGDIVRSPEHVRQGGPGPRPDRGGVRAGRHDRRLKAVENVGEFGFVQKITDANIARGNARHVVHVQDKIDRLS